MYMVLSLLSSFNNSTHVSYILKHLHHLSQFIQKMFIIIDSTNSSRQEPHLGNVTTSHPLHVDCHPKHADADLIHTDGILQWNEATLFWVQDLWFDISNHYDGDSLSLDCFPHAFFRSCGIHCSQHGSK